MTQILFLHSDPSSEPDPDPRCDPAQVEGMVTAEVLADDEEYAEVIQDLHEECGKYGVIRAVHVPRPPNPKVLAASVFGTGTYGKVCPPTCGPQAHVIDCCGPLNAPSACSALAAGRGCRKFCAHYGSVVIALHRSARSVGICPSTLCNSCQRSCDSEQNACAAEVAELTWVETAISIVWQLFTLYCVVTGVRGVRGCLWRRGCKGRHTWAAVCWYHCPGDVPDPGAVLGGRRHCRLMTLNGRQLRLGCKASAYLPRHHNRKGKRWHREMMKHLHSMLYCMS